MPVVVRPLESADLAAVLAMNNAAVPAVPPATRESIGELVTTASLAIVAEAEPGDPVGFLLAMDPGVDYDSENYRWFAARSDSFVYVDRIVIAETARGGGIGRALYAAVFDRATEFGRAEVTCEVNVRPANPGSLAFHARLGFEQLAEQETKGGAYRVALLAAPVRRSSARGHPLSLVEPVETTALAGERFRQAQPAEGTPPPPAPTPAG